jgi:hypothetical protein
MDLVAFLQSRKLSVTKDDATLKLKQIILRSIGRLLREMKSFAIANKEKKNTVLCTVLLVHSFRKFLQRKTLTQVVWCTQSRLYSHLINPGFCILTLLNNNKNGLLCLKKLWDTAIFSTFTSCRTILVKDSLGLLSSPGIRKPAIKWQ